MDNIITTPEISVLMPVYNAQDYVADAIQSILNQTYTNFEFIIINDGSTDKSTETLREFAEHDARIKLIEQENKGLIETLNIGIDTSSTNLIARMDADDIAVPTRLEKQKSYMDQNPDIVALGSAIEIIDEDSTLIKTAHYPTQKKGITEHLLTRGSPFAHPTVIMRKDAIERVGGYRSAYKHAEDYDLWLRLHKIGKLDNVTTPLLKYRYHTQSISTQNARQQAIVSVAARHAAQAQTDPTANLKRITEETLALFDADRTTLDWEIADIMLSRHLVAPENSALKSIENNLPKTIPTEAQIFASSTFQKFCFCAVRSQKYPKALRYFLKALTLAPISTLQKAMGRLRP